MSDRAQITVLACQLDVPADMQSISERDEHLDRVANLIDESLSSRSADVVVLPELSSISYTRHCFSHLETFAETSNGASFQKLSTIARKHEVYLLYGAPRIDEKGQSYISQFLIDSSGAAAGVYDKMHMAQFGASMEKDYFVRGSHLLVFDVKGVRIAPLICYDMRFPEMAFTLVRKHQVHALVHPVAFYKDESYYSWHAFVMARALENQAYWFSVNRAGSNYGNSILCPPWVDEASPETRFGECEELVWTDIDIAVIEDTRLRYTFGTDRLSDYHDL